MTHWYLLKIKYTLRIRFESLFGWKEFFLNIPLRKPVSTVSVLLANLIQEKTSRMTFGFYSNLRVCQGSNWNRLHTTIKAGEGSVKKRNEIRGLGKKSTVISQLVRPTCLDKNTPCIPYFIRKVTIVI